MGEEVSALELPNRAFAIGGLQLPDPVPTRIYIGNYEYKIGAPRIPLPPIANVVRLILNWSTTAGRIAKNVLYAKLGTGGTAVSSDPTSLIQIANAFVTQWNANAWPSTLTSTWKLNNVTAHDAGGTSAQGISTLVPSSNVVSPPTCPPNSAVVISWQIAESYRGGKPRTYLPGIPLNALADQGSGLLVTSFATTVESNANAMLTNFNAAPVLGTAVTLGTVSYHTGHSVRPTPLFRTFLSARTHERLDSQRRRIGKESIYPVVP